MLLQVDVDNTLYNSDACFAEAGKAFSIDFPRQYNYWFRPEDIGVELDQLLKLFEAAHGPGYIEQNKPYEGAAEVLADLARDYDDLEIAYVSDRSEDLQAPLVEWLRVHEFLTSDDQHVGVTKDKRHWMREKRPEIVIDDRVRTMLMARFELDAAVLSLEHPYNINLRQEVDGIYILPDWYEIDRVLRDLVIPAVQSKALSREIGV
jgi:hypothetical protein